MLLEGRVGPAALSDGNPREARITRTGEWAASDVHGKYFEASSRGNLFMARAIITAPVIFSTAAGTGGPLLWNGTTNKNASILAVGWGVTVVTTVAAAVGLTGASGQTAAPGTTTVIDSSANLFIGGSAPSMSVYRIGTVTNAGTFLLPLGELHTGALTVDTGGFRWVDIAGAVTVPPNAWCSFSASATASTTVIQVGLIWEELAA